MKNAVIFSLFLAFASCKNAETPATASPVLVAPLPELFVVDTSDVWVETAYTQVKPGKQLIVSKILALDYFEKHHQTLNPETQDYYDGLVHEIMDKTFIEGVYNKHPTPTQTLDFAQRKGNPQIYLNYFTRSLYYQIPIERVKQYLK